MADTCTEYYKGCHDIQLKRSLTTCASNRVLPGMEYAKGLVCLYYGDAKTKND